MRQKAERSIERRQFGQIIGGELNLANVVIAIQYGANQRGSDSELLVFGMNEKILDENDGFAVADGPDQAGQFFWRRSPIFLAFWLN